MPTNIHTADAPPAYRAALEGAAYADESASGRIFIRGRDRAGLLHRLSTADVERLKPGQGVRTVLTTPIGRIIDLLSVHALDDALLIVASQGQGGPVWSHLKKNIFFQDQVTLEPAGRSHGQLALYGPAAARLLRELSGAQVDGLPPQHTTTLAIAGAQVLAAARPPIGGPSFTLYVPAEHAEAVGAALVGGGAAPLDEPTFEILRVEQGYGAFGRELGQEYIPLETGLADAISFTKGCYVGQEIIARMESRGRLAKMLRGLKLTSKAQGPKTGADGSDPLVVGLSSLVLPTKLEVGGKEAGDLTSAVVSPRHGPIALAYVRTAHAEPGTIVGITGTELSGTVIELPFE
jgi:tRNA-modifying protein YgfZ